MLAVSGFLIPSSDTQAKHSGLCTVKQSWVFHTLLGHHLLEKPRKDQWLADLLPGYPKSLHLFLSSTGTPLSCYLEVFLLLLTQCWFWESYLISSNASVIVAIGYCYYHSRDGNMVTLRGRTHSAIKRCALLLLLLMAATHRYQRQNRSLSEHNYSPHCEIH